MRRMADKPAEADHGIARSVRISATATPIDATKTDPRRDGQALMEDTGPTRRVTIVESSASTHRIRPGWMRVILYAPFALLGGSFLLLLARATRPAMLWMLEEDHPIELLTFVFLFAGSLIGLRLARALRARGEKRWIYGFYAVFSVGLFVTAMEEIAWGQQLLGFETPESFRSINRQAETTLHNIGALQGRSEWLRLLFGLGGIVGVWLSFRPARAGIGAPAILLPWFLLVAAHAAVDAYNDFFPIQAQFDFTMQRTSEVVELLIAMAAFLYVLLNFRRLVPGAKPDGPVKKAS